MRIAAAAVSATLLLGIAPAHADVPGYSDIDDAWFSDAVHHVAVNNDWYAVDGDRFRPGRRTDRGEFASAVVAALGTEIGVDPELHFPDVADDDPLYAAANVATSQGWIRPRSDGRFAPAGNVKKRDMDRALVLALGLAEAAGGLRALATADGGRLALPPGFAYLVLADNLHLHFNHASPTERQELYPSESVRRRDAAYALSMAIDARGSWMLWEAQRFTDIVLPKMNDTRREVLEFALAYAGWPYVYAGEWYRETPDGYCCGPQKQGGFDCSGFMWWVLAEPQFGFDNTHVRPYSGWPLRERRASYMAERVRDNRVTFDDLKPADGIFYDTDGSGGSSPGWRHIDHGGIYLGNGWMIHSSGSRGGVTINWVGRDSWWSPHFVWGRRIVKN